VQGTRVLIVDDDAAIRDLLRGAFEGAHYETLTASSGHEALRLLDSAGTRPDLLLLDLIMPEVTGWDVLEHLRDAMMQRIPVLILSAQSPDASILSALDGELRDFVAKPFDLAELLVRSQALLRRSPRLSLPLRGHLRIYTLGSLRVYRDDTLLFDEGWRNKPAKIIFKLLFTNRGRRYPKDVLAEELWPDTEPVAAANRLRVAVHELRKMLGGRRKDDNGPNYIAQQEGTYFFDASLPLWTDMEAFEEHAQHGVLHARAGELDAALEAYRQADTLYQDDYLRDDPFLEWSIGARERLRELHLTMLAEAASILAGRGFHAEAAGFCRKILRIEPWREEVYRRLMEYLLAAGRPHEALRAFDECRRALRSEVDAEPSMQTVALRQSIADAMSEGPEASGPFPNL